MTERDIIMDTAAKKIAEAQRQRDKARRELSTARSVIKKLLLAFTADYEACDGDDGLEYKGEAFRRAQRFLDKGKRK